MRTSLVRGLAVVAGALGVVSMAGAAEPFAKGVAVARELADAEGHRFVITFTAPAGRGVDPRVMDAFDISFSRETPSASKPVTRATSLGESGVFAQIAAHKATTAGDPEEDAVDVSGYTIDVHLLSTTGCRGTLKIVKSKPANLNAGAFLAVRASDGPAAMEVTAYPTSGDVDAGVAVNDGDSVCSVSDKGKGTLDVAGCSESSCNPAGDVLTGEILNVTGSSAKFVGAVTIQYSN
jgi:hypothetical protein